MNIEVTCENFYNVKSFGNCLSGGKVLPVFTKQAWKKCASLSKVSKTLGICKKTVPLNWRTSTHNSTQKSIIPRKTLFWI